MKSFAIFFAVIVLALLAAAVQPRGGMPELHAAVAIGVVLGN